MRKMSVPIYVEAAAPSTIDARNISSKRPHHSTSKKGKRKAATPCQTTDSQCSSSDNNSICDKDFDEQVIISSSKPATIQLVPSSPVVLTPTATQFSKENAAAPDPYSPMCNQLLTELKDLRQQVCHNIFPM